MRGHHESGDGNTRGIGWEESNDLSRSQMLLNGTDSARRLRKVLVGISTTCDRLTKSSWPLGAASSTGTGGEML